MISIEYMLDNVGHMSHSNLDYDTLFWSDVDYTNSSDVIHISIAFLSLLSLNYDKLHFPISLAL